MPGVYCEYDDDEEFRSDGNHVYKKNCGIGSNCVPKSQCGTDGKFWAMKNGTVKLGDKERFDKEQISVKEPFPATNLPIYFIRIRNIWR